MIGGTMNGISITDTDGATCDECPGPERCWLIHSVSPKAAYVSGCRTKTARAANTAYAASHRAKLRAQNAGKLLGEWGTPDIPEPAESITELCPRCGEPLEHIPGRAGLSCVNGHFAHAPETAGRSADAESDRKRERAVAEITETRPSVMDLVNRDIERDRIARLCESAPTELNTDFMRSVSHVTESWNPEVVARFRAIFRSLMDQALRADSETLPELNEIYLRVRTDPGFATACAIIRDLKLSISEPGSLITGRVGESGEEYDDESSPSRPRGQTYKERTRGIARDYERNPESAQPGKRPASQGDMPASEMYRLTQAQKAPGR
jgi:hypothetical protein